MITLLSAFVYAGFFNEEGDANKAIYIENDRLCKLFTKKVEKYKKNMRDDFLATASLVSYEYRAELFCTKAKEAKKEL